MERKTQSVLVGLLLAGAAIAASVDIAAARGVMGAMGGHGGPQGLMRAEFSELDANGDGAISMSEMQAVETARFAALDLDASGALDQAEVIAMISAGIEQRMARGPLGGHGEQGAGNGEHARPNRPAPDDARLAWMAKGMLLRFDKNDDGLISAEEMQPPAQRLERLFAKVDTDGNSAISEAEFDAAKAKRGGRTRP